VDNNELLDRVQQKEKWLRGLFMVLFLVVLWIVKILFLAIILLQFAIVLITDNVNVNLQNFSKMLSSYAYQIYIFLTYNSDEKPFPFGDWPKT
jgi:hypothetical protein